MRFSNSFSSRKATSVVLPISFSARMDSHSLTFSGPLSPKSLGCSFALCWSALRAARTLPRSMRFLLIQASGRLAHARTAFRSCFGTLPRSTRAPPKTRRSAVTNVLAPSESLIGTTHYESARYRSQTCGLWLRRALTGTSAASGGIGRPRQQPDNKGGHRRPLRSDWGQFRRGSVENGAAQWPSPQPAGPSERPACRAGDRGPAWREHRHGLQTLRARRAAARARVQRDPDCARGPGGVHRSLAPPFS